MPKTFRNFPFNTKKLIFREVEERRGRREDRTITNKPEQQTLFDKLSAVTSRSLL